MKKPLILLLPALALLQIGCRSHRPVQPEFEQLAIDTLLERRGADCRIEYRFATIRNTSESAALQAIETANIGYFFQVEAFEGNAAQAAELAIREIDTTLLADVQPTQTYEISIESEGTPPTRWPPMSSRAQATRAVLTASTGSNTTPTRSRAVWRSLRETCSPNPRPNGSTK